MLELKAENTRLSNELEALKVKVVNLESSNPVELSQSVISQVLQETFAREKCQSNLIIYGVPESTSSDVAEQIAHDKATVKNLLVPLGNVVPQHLKLVRLCKSRVDPSRPIKSIFDNKESALNVLSGFNTAKHSAATFPEGFRMVSDKSQLQRKLLRSCYIELDRRTNNGESGLRIIFENGLPKVRAAILKTENFVNAQ